MSAAHALLHEAGEDGVTLRAIARRIGISAPSIYAHFTDRESVLLAVAIDAFADLTRYLRAAADAADTGSGGESEVLRAVCAGYLRFAREHPADYQVMFGGAWNGARAVETGAVTTEQVRELGAEALTVFATALRRCHATHDAVQEDIATAATTVWVGLHGLAHQRIVAPGFPWPADAEAHLIARLTGLPATPHP